MFLTAAVLLFALGAVNLFEARKSAKHHPHHVLGKRVIAGLLLLAGAGVATYLGAEHSSAFMGRLDLNCTHGMGARCSVPRCGEADLA